MYFSPEIVGVESCIELVKGASVFISGIIAHVAMLSLWALAAQIFHVSPGLLSVVGLEVVLYFVPKTFFAFTNRVFKFSLTFSYVFFLTRLKGSFLLVDYFFQFLCDPGFVVAVAFDGFCFNC